MRIANRTVLLLAFVCAVPVIAQMPGSLPPGAKKVPGEMWRQKVSMKAAGMSMPGRTMEFCAPRDNPESANEMLPDKNCTMYDVQRSGNKTSMKFRCTGKDAAEGSMELSRSGDTMIMDMLMRSKDSGEMAMHGESTKLGKACEAVDFSGVKLPEAPAAPDICGEMMKDLRKDMSKLEGAASTFISKDGTCAKHASKKEFCEIAQTPGGFLTLHRAEYRLDKQVKEFGNSAMAGRDPATRLPLQNSLQSCGLGKGSAAAASVRAKLLPIAEQKKSWHFLAAEGDQAALQKLQVEAKTNCTGRAFTEGKSPETKSLCLYYGPDLIAGRFENVRKIAMGDSDLAGSSVEAFTADGAAAASQGGSAGQGGEAATPDGEKPNKTKDAVEKGKKILRGILGK